MKYTQIPSTAFKSIQLNAGILLDEFQPSTQTIGNIIGATSGGVNFTATPEFSDYGEDIDNCPANMKELKKITSIEAKMSGTFISVSAELAKTLIGSADIDSADSTHVIPRKDIVDADFQDIWWVGDYSDINTDDGDTHSAGCVAIHLMNALSTGGFQIQSSDDAKGTFSFEFTGHFSMDAQDTVPYEIYIIPGK